MERFGRNQTGSIRCTTCSRWERSASSAISGAGGLAALGHGSSPSRRTSVRSITSSAPPPMDNRRPSRKYRDTHVSSM